MNPGLFVTFGVCLGLTILLETAFALFVGIRGRKNLLLVVLVQIITNPLAVLAMLWFGTYYYNWPVYAYQLPIEAIVVVVEWLFYRKYLNAVKRPFALSLAANYFSYSFGFILSGFGFYW